MKFKIILAAGLALSVIAMSANAQLLNGPAGIQTGGDTGTTGRQVVASPGTVVSVTDRAMRNTTLQSRGAMAVAGQPARVIADAADGVVVAGGVDGRVSSDAGFPSVSPSQIAARGKLLDNRAAVDAQ